MDYKKVFDKFEEENIFIKTTHTPSIDGAQKAALNRKGNMLYNAGNIEAARRIFLTTGYSDGLSRIGDYYQSQGRYVDALRMYWIAPDRTKSDPVIMRISALLQDLIHEEEDHPDE
jgi:tetratricopeptide (TPR) repeat protein